MRYYIIAGEASGDLHAANLVKAILQKDPGAQFRGLGGDGMRDAGVSLLRHYRDTAYMGFIEVLLHLRKILKNIKLCKDDMLQWQPDVLILVDYPGFNLRIAPFAHQHGIKVAYYISPQLWAWKSGRVEIIKKSVDKMFVILPFEEAFYLKYDYPVEFVGHPLLDALNTNIASGDFMRQHALDNKKYIAVLPGSRKQEISVKLPVMLSMVKHFPEFHFVVACAPGIDRNFYDRFATGERIHYIHGATYDILRHAHSAMVTSGTATLETALFRVPEIVCYKGSAISYFIAKRLVHIKYISLVNLIADDTVVPELIQHEFNASNLQQHLEQLISDDAYRNNMLAKYDELKTRLGGPGASERTARSIVQWIKP